MVAFQELQVVVVTPEKTVLDEMATSLRFPLYDGQIGLLPGRAPMVGRLGYGELQVTTSRGTHSYYIDGGFVQVKGNVVSLITSAAVPAAKIDVSKAEAQLAEAQQRKAENDADFVAKERDQLRARQKISIARTAG